MRHQLLTLSRVAVVLAAAATPVIATAQPTQNRLHRPEVFVATGPGNLSHGDDALGWGMTLGAGGTIPIVGGLAIRLEAERAFGPSPVERSCSSYDVPCEGAGRYGVQDLTILAASAVYYFGQRRVQPYVVAGLDILNFTFLSDVTYLGRNPIVIAELEQRHTTMGILFGGGVRIPFGRLFVSPEVVVYDGTILAGANLTQVRPAVAIGYQF